MWGERERGCPKCSTHTGGFVGVCAEIKKKNCVFVFSVFLCVFFGDSEFSSRYHLSARKNPYALHPVSQNFHHLSWWWMSNYGLILYLSHYSSLYLSHYSSLYLSHYKSLPVSLQQSIPVSLQQSTCLVTAVYLSHYSSLYLSHCSSLPVSQIK